MPTKPKSSGGSKPKSEPKSKAKAQPKNPYSVHPGVAMVQKWVKDLPEKTGRSLDQWLALIKKSGPPTEKQRRTWLKAEYGLGTNTAWWLAERAGGTDTWNDDPAKYLQAALVYVDEMFAGPKSALRPIYDRLLALGFRMGPDVKACPCKTIVPLYRNHVFAQIKPTTRTRIDFGLALRDTKATGRLIDTGGFAQKDRITHRIEISSLDDIDAEVEAWLVKAYEMDE